MVIALLHAGARLSPSFSVHPSTVIGIIGLAVLYERGSKGWGRAANGTNSPLSARPSTLQRFWYYGALILMFFSLNGWLHDLSDTYLFSAHMLQHLLLTLVVPPLMIMGTPGGMLRPALSIPGIAPVARWITKPAHAFTIFSVTIAGWHLPPLYNYALAHHPVHIVEHLMFMVASVLMWWPILSPMPELPRLSYPGQMLYLFLMSIPMSIVSVYITYSDTVLYPLYASAPRVWGITPMNDQLIGGLIMWIPGGLFFYGIISVIFFRWQQRGALDTQAGAQVDFAIPAAE